MQQDKAPYIIYVEVVEVLDSSCSPTPEKILNNLRHVRSEEQLPDDSPSGAAGGGATHSPSVVSSGATPGGGSSNSSHSGATSATTASHHVGLRTRPSGVTFRKVARLRELYFYDCAWLLIGNQNLISLQEYCIQGDPSSRGPELG